MASAGLSGHPRPSFPSPGRCHRHETTDPRLQHPPSPRSPPPQVLTLPLPPFHRHLQRSAAYQGVGGLGGGGGGLGAAGAVGSPPLPPDPSSKDTAEPGRCPQPLPQPCSPPARPAGGPAVGEILGPGLLRETRDTHTHTRTPSPPYVYVRVCAYLYKHTHMHVYTDTYIHAANECPGTLPHACPPAGLPQPPSPAPAAPARRGGPGAPGGGVGPRRPGAGARRGGAAGRRVPRSHRRCHTHAGRNLDREFTPQRNVGRDSYRNVLRPATGPRRAGVPVLPGRLRGRSGRAAAAGTAWGKAPSAP